MTTFYMHGNTRILKSELKRYQKCNGCGAESFGNSYFSKNEIHLCDLCRSKGAIIEHFTSKSLKEEERRKRLEEIRIKREQFKRDLEAKGLSPKQIEHLDRLEFGKKNYTIKNYSDEFKKKKSEEMKKMHRVVHLLRKLNPGYTNRSGLSYVYSILRDKEKNLTLDDLENYFNQKIVKRSTIVEEKEWD